MGGLLVFRKYRGYFALSGAMLMHFTLGTLYTYANMSTYLISYLHHHNSSVGFEVSSWIFTAAFIGVGGFMLAGGYLELLIGTKFTAVIGALLYSGGIFCSSFFCFSFPAILILYGLVCGIGFGISYGIDVSIGVRWFPNKAGLANGIVLGSFGLGTLVFNPIVTKLVNPHNDPLPDGGDFYVGEILDNVPSSIRILGGTYFVIQIIALILMANPPHFNLTSDTVIDARASSEIISFDAIDEKLVDDYLTEGNDRISSNDGIEPKIALQSSQFYVTWVCHGINALCLTIISTFWKTLGLHNATEDDSFLALIGSFSSICNAASRVFWGLLTDKIGFKSTCVAIFGCLSILTALINSIHDKWLFAVFVGSVYFMNAGFLTAEPTTIAYTFGPKRLPIMLGILTTSQAFTSVLGSILVSTLMSKIGLAGIFLIVSIMSLLAMMVIIFLYKPITYRELLMRSRYH